MTRRKTGVLISGRGSNLKCLIEACAAPDYPAEIVLVVSNRANAAGLDHARAAGIAHVVVPHRDYADRESFDAAVTGALERAGVEIVCLAGFMRLLSDAFVTRWHDRLLNIHPSLLPAFKGTHAHRDALAAGVRFSGCTVHFVRLEMDSGPIIVQAAVPVAPDDTEATLGARVLAAEHRAYPLALRLVASGRARTVGARVEIDGAAAPSGYALNPAE
ncbi:MAG: phosphoribosylglycinamide formyltransferase [Acetobacterales bacterium]